MYDYSKPFLFTPGEPAGVGPDLALELIEWGYPVAVVGSAQLLQERAQHLNKHCDIQLWQPGQLVKKGCLAVMDIPLAAACRPGALESANASYVWETLAAATQLCLSGEASGLVTGPVHKATMILAGFEFPGHTEVLAHWTGAEHVVMMLVNGNLRVALQTTHLPLAQVPSAITQDSLKATIAVLTQELAAQLGIPKPRIGVCGLNPHAGEQGQLGQEEQEVMIPALEWCRRKGYQVFGPFPADTIFCPETVSQYDVILAMYHDQGLPVLKSRGLEASVNVTLGLPIIRTSVGHGTALHLAGTGKVQSGSLRSAIELCLSIP